jgi:hypothetical protein
MLLDSLNGVASIALEIEERLRFLRCTTIPTVRQIRKEFTSRLSGAPPFVILEISTLLLHQPGLKFRLLAYELLGCNRDALLSLRPVDLSQLGVGIDSRASADVFAMSLVGPLWCERSLPDELVYGWASSGSRWWKRIAVVSTIRLSERDSKGLGFDDRILRVFSIVVAERDSDVVSSLASALRPLLRSNVDTVQSFLQDLRVVGHPAIKRLQRSSVRRERRSHPSCGLSVRESATEPAA